MLEQNVYTVGTAATTVVAPTIDSARYVLKNLEPASNGADYSRAGYLYGVAQEFSIAGPGTARFSFLTGANGAQIESYEIISTIDNVKAELVEGATITSGAAVTGYNLNRNESDLYQSSMATASAFTGGSVISSELITADKHAASGGQQTAKIITLRPNTKYGFRFINQGNQTTSVHFQMAWSERYNGLNSIWLGTIDDSYVLHGGEEMTMYLRPYETINAVAQVAGSKLAVMRQD